jgi:hypothetical protein
MRIVIDLRGAQGVNRTGRIGGFPGALAKTMIIGAGSHEAPILLNDSVADAAELLLGKFSARLPKQNICSGAASQTLQRAATWHAVLDAEQVSESVRSALPDLKSICCS